ncbi:hypothetical protein [Kitasatospora sp. CB01950]|uniref:hypothetical protein n=1 Tax=Kitasatospora sp. CB01950 TaxID=1703930 RepID=UPI00093C61F8|nr:hypothetical protein [Kitasatospora sp. CB01950]
MTRPGLLFNDGDLAEVLHRRITQIRGAVEAWDEDRLLSISDADIVDALRERFLAEAPTLQRDGTVSEGMREETFTVREFGEDAMIRQNVFTIAIPFTGERILFSLCPSTRSFSPPAGEVGASELKLSWRGQGRDHQKIKQSLDRQTAVVEGWLEWARTQIGQHNLAVETTLANAVRNRKAAILANRGVEEFLGFPIRRRPDAATYAVPVTRRRIDTAARADTSAAAPFRPEPALADASYEDAIRVLLSSRNQLERSPSLTSTMNEETIRDLLLVNLNSQFMGKAAGEVFNASGKTDILIREEDRHVFIGECKFWKGPKTITSALDQLLSYLVWRDTKAALLLFIRTGTPTDIIPKALDMIRQHPNFKREGIDGGEIGERYDFVLSSKNDPAREIRLAFLPFALLAAGS